jgi:hypothetical protein
LKGYYEESENTSYTVGEIFLNHLSGKSLGVPMEFYAAMKKNAILSFTSKWMKLENILSEVSLAQKTNNHMFSFICGHWIKGKHNKGIGL